MRTEAAKKAQRKWNKANPGKIREYRRRRYYKYRDRLLISNRAAALKHRDRLWAEILAAYGNVCRCCGESNPRFLTIDHVFNDGKEHRKSIRQRGGGRTTWSAIKRAGFPQDRYRLLCYNCNCGRARNGGVCPHRI